MTPPLERAWILSQLAHSEALAMDLAAELLAEVPELKSQAEDEAAHTNFFVRLMQNSGYELHDSLPYFKEIHQVIMKGNLPVPLRIAGLQCVLEPTAIREFARLKATDPELDLGWILRDEQRHMELGIDLLRQWRTKTTQTEATLAQEFCLDLIRTIDRRHPMEALEAFGYDGADALTWSQADPGVFATAVDALRRAGVEVGQWET